RIWRIPRPLRAEDGDAARVVKTFEDTPFYSRSLVEIPILGAPRRAMHECFSGDRLKSPIIKSLLPVRMPRRTR
ncbi:MAG: carotenoid 1,2-hydratase, partial [Pseudomonadota bacterium]